MFATLAGCSSRARCSEAGEPEIDAGATFERVHLDDHSWVDVAREWMRGADTLLDALLARVEWKQGKRWMYERMVDDPRLSRWFPAAEPVPHPVLDAARARSTARYGVRFGSVGLELLPRRGRQRRVAQRQGAPGARGHAHRDPHAGRPRARS